MEYEGLGARCSLTSCGKLDYLPYKCANCALPFCDSHHLPSQHQCKSSTPRVVPTCPLCNSAVPAKSGQTLDDAMAIHIDSGCPKRPRNNPICSLSSCNVRDPAATRCPSCKQIFCVSHCVEITHQCKATKPINPKNPFNKQLNKNKQQQQQQQQQRNKNKNSNNNNSTSTIFTSNTLSTTTKQRTAVISTNFINKISNPIGDNLNSIDPQDKIHLSIFFNISLPNNNQLIRPRFMCFTNKNSAGKIIDVVRKHVSDVPQPPKGKRYSLYAIKPDLSRVNLLPYITPLKDLRDIITNGDLVVLQLADDGLDPSVFNALKIAARSGLFGSSAASSNSSRFLVGKRIPKPPERTNTKCLLA